MVMQVFVYVYQDICDVLCVHPTSLVPRRGYQCVVFIEFNLNFFLIFRSQ